MAATLNFEIDVSTLDMSAQDALLALLDTEPLLTLSVLGDEPGAEPQLFDVCAAGGMPSVGGCVAVLWLDENGMPLEPFGAINPAVLRFEALVGHFSTYSIVAAATLPGDFNNDGRIDAADYVVWRKTDGTQTGYDAWRSRFGSSQGQGSGSAGYALGASAKALSTEVPEPATASLMIFATAICRWLASRIARPMPV
jgi:hypothetical protein